MGTVHGLQPFSPHLETLKRAVPDARAVIEEMREAGDAVIVEGDFSHLASQLQAELSD
jgi:hypothetical protein